MNHTRLLSFVLLVLFVSVPAFAQQAALLPAEFSGWQKAGSPRTGDDAAAADAQNADVLKEAGLSDFEHATYKREDREIQIKAYRFADATGAYSMFSLLKAPEMIVEKIGTQAATNSLENRVLFYNANVLVDAKLDRISAMTLSELRSLAAALPKVSGPAAKLPILPQYLPKSAYVKNSAKFALGPAGLARLQSPLTTELVDFNRGAELVQGEYETLTGRATMVLISYPTPQIAVERMQAIEAYEAGHQHTAESPNGYAIKRTGPMVAMMHGEIPGNEARSLLASVNYDANVMWSESTGLEPHNNVGSLLMNIIYLIVILVGFAFVAGVAFGGFRMLMKRIFPDRVFDRSQDMEIIRLDLGK